MNSYNRANPEDFFDGVQLELGRAIYNADIERMKTLLPQVDVNAHGKKGLSFLLLAVNQAIPEQDNADVNNKRWQAVKLLVQAGAAVDDGATQPQVTPLTIALRAKSPHFLRALLDGGMNPNQMLYGEKPILFEVTRDASLASLKLLVERGADVNMRDSLGNTALYGPSGLMHIETVQYLLSKGADVSVVNRAGVSYGWVLKLCLDGADSKNPYAMQMMAIRDNLIKQGKLQWPPDNPLTERNRMRERGETPIVPAGQTQ
jgi:ankyrin repeat protein